MLKLHFPLSEAPLFGNPVVEWEHLSRVSEPMREKRLTTHIAVSLEAFNVTLDTLGDLLGQLTYDHTLLGGFMVKGRELSVCLSAIKRTWTFGLHTPTLTLHELCSRHECWKDTLETGDGMRGELL